MNHAKNGQDYRSPSLSLLDVSRINPSPLQLRRS